MSQVSHHNQQRREKGLKIYKSEWSINDPVYKAFMAFFFIYFLLMFDQFWQFSEILGKSRNPTDGGSRMVAV